MKFELKLLNVLLEIVESDSKQDKNFIIINKNGIPLSIKPHKPFETVTDCSYFVGFFAKALYVLFILWYVVS